MRFKLKSLFLFVTIAALALSISLVFTEGWRRKHQISNQLRSAGAADFAFSYRNHLQFVSFNKDIASPGLPEFVRIDRLDMTGCQSDKINFHNVRNADIWHLLLRSTPTSDSSLEHLKNVAQLRILDLTNTEVSDLAVESIASIKGLKGVYLTGTGVTLTGAELLKRLRPEVWLVHESIGVEWDGRTRP